MAGMFEDVGRVTALCLRLNSAQVGVWIAMQYLLQSTVQQVAGCLIEAQAENLERRTT